MLGSLLHSMEADWILQTFNYKSELHSLPENVPGVDAIVISARREHIYTRFKYGTGINEGLH